MARGERSRTATSARLVPRALTSRPSVSVVIPCFNYGRFVEQAIRSALNQEGVDLDVIVVDDCSTDNSRDVVREVAARDPRVRLIVHDRNRGPVDTFNDGLAVATGEYIVRLDADDLLCPGALARAAAVGEALPRVGLIYGHPLHFEDALPIPRQHPRRWRVWPGHVWLYNRVVTGANVITSGEVLMRRSAVDLVGGQRHLPHTHDMEMWLRMSAVCDVAYIEGADQLWHREHPDSLSRHHTAWVGDIRDRRDAFHTLLDWMDPIDPRAAELRRTADRTLTVEAYSLVQTMYDRGRVDLSAREELLAFAGECSGDEPPPRVGRAVQRMIARGSGGRPTLARLSRRVKRAIATRTAFRRWHRLGVFTRDVNPSSLERRQ